LASRSDPPRLEPRVGGGPGRSWTRSITPWSRIAFALAGCVLPWELKAQLTSDEVPIGRTITAQEALKADLDNSRFRLGPFRFVPGFALTNAGYNNNLFGSTVNPTGDWTATIAAGTKVIVPFSSKVYLLGDAFPSYTAYASFSDLNHFGGAAHASVAGYFNRLSIEAGGSGFSGVVAPTPEQPAPTIEKSVFVFAKLEVDLTKRISFFGGGEGQEVRQNQTGVPLKDRSNVERNNRTDDAFNGGLRFSLGSAWTIAPELQYTTTRFVETPDERNNESIGYLMGASYTGNKFYLNLIGGYREGKPYQGSTFPSYATPVGSFFASYFLRPWLELRGYGHRTVTYSITVTNPYYFGNLIGGGLNIQVLKQVLLRGFGETGENKYPILQTVAGAEFRRIDKLVTYGGGASVILYKNLTLTGLVSQRQDRSSIPLNDYSILQYSTFLTFTGEFMR
jgi:hypothetical protein